MESHSQESNRIRAAFSPEELSSKTTAFLMAVEGANSYREDTYSETEGRVERIAKQHKLLLAYSGMTIVPSNASIHYDDITQGGEERLDSQPIDDTLIRVGIQDHAKFGVFLEALPRASNSERQDIEQLLTLVSHEYRYHSYDAFYAKRGDMTDTFYSVLYDGELYTKLFAEKLSLPGKDVSIHNNFDMYFLYAGAVTTKEGMVKDFFETFGVVSEQKLVAQYGDREKYIDEIEMMMRKSFAVFFQGDMADGAQYTSEDDLVERDNKYDVLVHELDTIFRFVEKSLHAHYSQHATTPFLLYATAQLAGFVRAFDVIVKNGGTDNAAWVQNKMKEMDEYRKQCTHLIESLLADEVLAVQERKKLEKALADIQMK